MIELTYRQQQVLELVAAGYSAKEIAALLGLHARTVEFHKNRLCRKAQASGAVAMLRQFYNFIPRRVVVARPRG